MFTTQAYLTFLLATLGLLCQNSNGISLRDMAAMKDAKHKIKMGVLFPGCDDGETDLNVDWNGSRLNYTCFRPNEMIPVDELIEPVQHCEKLSNGYYPQHHCMDEKITYNSLIPTYGDHRPLWPVYGEYTFVPPQRWLHNIEHGAVVMLYHPCTEPKLVQQLRHIVTSCIRKHIITPYVNVSIKRPLVLVTWGCKLEMDTVDEELVKSFIKKTALKGPEGGLAKEGQYVQLLKTKAKIPLGSDENDSVLCPSLHITPNLNVLDI